MVLTEVGSLIRAATAGVDPQADTSGGGLVMPRIHNKNIAFIEHGHRNSEVSKLKGSFSIVMFVYPMGNGIPVGNLGIRNICDLIVNKIWKYPNIFNQYKSVVLIILVGFSNGPPHWTCEPKAVASKLRGGTKLVIR